MSGGTHPELEERERLAASRAEGLSLRASAARLGRAASTVSRELRRNALPRGGYPPPHRPVRCPSDDALMSAVNTLGRERPATPLGRWRSSSRTGGSEASWTSVTSSDARVGYRIPEMRPGLSLSYSGRRTGRPHSV